MEISNRYPLVYIYILNNKHNNEQLMEYTIVTNGVCAFLSRTVVQLDTLTLYKWTYTSTRDVSSDRPRDCPST